VLRPQADGETSVQGQVAVTAKPKTSRLFRRGTYRPSHKATFIGLAVVVMILAINAGVIIFFMRSQSQTSSKENQAEVTISPAVLDTLGVSRSTAGSSETELVVGPNSTFKNKVTIGGDVSIAGELKLNSKLIGTDASLAKLDAGNTSLSQLNVNGDATISSLSLRKDLTVVGLTRLQGAVTVSQLLTVNNNMNVLGNLSVGGTLFINMFQINTLSIGGHVITRGAAPSVSVGPAAGSSGTASISGNDAAGTIAVGVGTGGGNGTMADVSFINQYGSTPHVIITSVGSAGSNPVNFYVNRSSSGFNIGVNGALSPGGYIFDYIVMQ